jgi:hypothetical protein
MKAWLNSCVHTLNLPSSVVAIFRRFGALNLQNIIYLQAELAELEQELQRMVAEDNHNPDSDWKMFSRDWRIDESAISKEPENPRYKLILRIRKVLNDYS